MLSAGAGDYIARLASSGRSIIEILGYLKERFPDATTASITAVYREYERSHIMASNFGPSSSGTLPPTGPRGGGSGGPNCNYTIRLTFVDPITDKVQYRVTSFPSDHPLTNQEQADRAQTIAEAMQRPSPEPCGPPSADRRQQELELLEYQYFEVLYYECR